jgi:hypothetical protein
MNPMQLKNVVVLEDVKSFYQLGAQTELMPPRYMLEDVIWGVATKYPHWELRVIGGVKHAAEDAFTAHKFAVYQDREKIGEICLERYRREYAIGISNGRIRGTLDRGDTTYTKDTKKALSIVSKMFSLSTTHERVEAAAKKVDGEMRKVEWSAKRKVQGVLDSIRTTVMDYTLDHARQEYEAYVREQPNGARLLSELGTYDKDLADLATVEETKQAVATGRTCLVVLSNGSYIIQHRDSAVQAYDDSTLPENLRGKIGLLKLVTDSQMVAGVGFRVDDFTFLVITE